MVAQSHIERLLKFGVSIVHPGRLPSACSGALHESKRMADCFQ
ncbi:MAG: hypothetical protein RI884_2169 [Pseudomonadota bacterium]|jgi:hypothetical protein